jgi:hypothetical protein
MKGAADRNPALMAQYEQLRCDALRRGALATHGLGLALLLRQGMTAWIRAWSEGANNVRGPSPSPLRLPAPLPSEVRSQLTLILASLLTRPRQQSHP